MWKIHLMTLMYVAIVFDKASADCKSGVLTTKGDCCVFPFKYLGQTYDSCTFADSSKPWCSLTSDYDKDKKFGNCEFKTCQIKTTDGDCCVFPFEYGSVSYYACTRVNDPHQNAWCGTKSEVEWWTRSPRGNCRSYVEPCFSNPCKNNGTCHTDKSSFHCECTEDYKGETCSEKVLPCEKSPCENGGKCEDTDDGFSCHCLEGYVGPTCGEIIIDPCKAKPCKNGGKCFSDLSKDNFTCICPPGFDGDVCSEKVYPCDSSPCEHDGVCENTKDSFVCNCTKEYEGQTCSDKADPCKTSPCENDGKCFSDVENGGFYCRCLQGYEGTTCGKKVIPCDSLPCKNSGKCVNNGSSFQCECTQNFEGKTCEIKVDPCKAEPCKNGGKCFSDLSKEEFTCSCLPGFYGDDCSEKVCPCDSSPCKHGGVCENTKDDFVCKCPKEYEGKTCSDKVDPCRSSPCKNEGTCQSKDDEFTCECARGFIGPTCETKLDPCGSSPCEKGGICKTNGPDYTCDCSKAGGFSGPNCANKGFWTSVAKLTPPFHIAADGFRDLGARFVDLNGDGRMDLVFHRWLSASNIQKGAYLNLPKQGFVSAPEFTPPFHIAADCCGDLGARFVDLNGDGKVDMVFHRWLSSKNIQKGAYLNTGTGWLSAPQYTPPFHIAASGYSDMGARFVELNGDGKIDFVFHRWLNRKNQQKGAYLNTGNGWKSAPEFTPPFHIAADRYKDLGARFTDLNGDGKADLVYNRWINVFHQQKGAYLNNGQKWVKAPQYTPPFQTAVDGLRDTGLRLIDFNGDGKIDIVYHRWLNGIHQKKGAYLNNGNGWTNTPSYTPPFHIAADKYGDLGARFADVNGDGLIDFVYHRWISSSNQQKGAYVNTGCGWRSEPKYTPLFHIAADGHWDLGARFVELNGDGAIDLAYHRWLPKNRSQKGAYLACGDTNPAFCLIYSKYCSSWKVAYSMCRLTCNTCTF